ncbi:hypothetical protein EVAR_64939_1 [Eumeta japonica]|uniref:Uncharacterized protein n=1 Tax=Eumeta variegata TaxID=151549 RepID=A0A4C1Z912_EUMVA|nr:hypothetical protein EVAR_64939_1 [Eumeta japonica]
MTTPPTPTFNTSVISGPKLLAKPLAISFILYFSCHPDENSLSSFFIARQKKCNQQLLTTEANPHSLLFQVGGLKVPRRPGEGREQLTTDDVDAVATPVLLFT